MSEIKSLREQMQTLPADPDRVDNLSKAGIRYMEQERSKEAQILLHMVGPFYDDDHDLYLAPIVELLHELYPYLWYWNRNRIPTDEYMMELAYQQGRIAGKREERAKRHRTKSA